MKVLRKRWTKDETLLALRLYWETPFGRQHSGHPPIKELALKLDRTSGSVAMKLNNFTSLDPAERARGIMGLSGASNLDREVWGEFVEDPLRTVEKMEVLFGSEMNSKLTESMEQGLDRPQGNSEIDGLRKIRRHQNFFRKVVLGSYGSSCCLTGLRVPQVLRASHIKPWAVSKVDRVNPRNGLCLNALHDSAFDSGLITFDEDLRAMVSRVIKDYLPDDEIQKYFVSFEGVSLRKPEKNLPDPQFMEYHRNNIFKER